MNHPQKTEKSCFLFADCAVTPEPTSEQLVDIAVCSEKSARVFLAEEPKIALLSFSTKGSAKHPLVEKVQEAARMIKEKYPELPIDGELQADAALVEEVGQLKAKGSKVAGHANVFIFPDLNAGNISYKLVQRLGGFDAYGPICQDLQNRSTICRAMQRGRHSGHRGAYRNRGVDKLTIGLKEFLK